MSFKDFISEVLTVAHFRLRNRLVILGCGLSDRKFIQAVFNALASSIFEIADGKCYQCA